VQQRILSEPSSPKQKQSLEKTSFTGKFIDQTFHVVERAPWKFIDVSLGRRAPPVKIYCSRFKSGLMKKW